MRSGLPYVPPQDYKYRLLALTLTLARPNYNPSPDPVPSPNPNPTRYLLSTLDNDSSGDISLREFGDFIDVAQFSYVRVHRRSYPERSLPGVYRLLGVERFKPFAARPATEGWGLNRLLWVVLVLNAARLPPKCPNAQLPKAQCSKAPRPQGPKNQSPITDNQQPITNHH